MNVFISIFAILVIRTVSCPTLLQRMGGSTLSVLISIISSILKPTGANTKGINSEAVHVFSEHWYIQRNILTQSLAWNINLLTNVLK